MAYEAVLRVEKHPPVPMVCASASQAFEKGAIMILSDENLASGASSLGQNVGGILAYEKVANADATALAVYDSGTFDMYASGAINVGSPVVSAGVPANQVRAWTSGTHSGAQILGYAKGTATDQEQILVELAIGGA